MGYVKTPVQHCKICGNTINCDHKKFGNNHGKFSHCKHIIKSDDGVYVGRIWVCNSCYNQLFKQAIYNVRNGLETKQFSNYNTGQWKKINV